MSRPVPAARLAPVTLEGPAGALEGLLQERAEHDHRLVALVCHPHPLYGGTLHNKVVHRVASTLFGLGAAVLRFNFRGVGRSEGVHDEGRGELEDARAALRWLEARYPAVLRWAGGFSFGSSVAARLAASEPEVRRVILVAPPVRSGGFESLRTSTVPKLVVQGDHDVNCPLDELMREFPSWAEPKRMVVVPGATHFFDKQLGALSEVLVQELSGPASEATSWTT